MLIPKNLKSILISLICLLSLVPTKGVFAATCNDQADGDWNSTSTWDCGIVPNGDDDVTIDSHIVTITADSLSNTVTIDGGTLNMESFTHINDNGWTYTSGTVNTGTSTLTFYGTSNLAFTPGSIEYYNLEWAKGPWDLTISGTVNVLNNLIISTTTDSAEIRGGVIEVEGDFVGQSSYGFGGETTVRFVGDNDQSIYSNGGELTTLEFEKTGGILTIQDDLVARKNWTWISGDIDFGTNTLEFTTSGGTNYHTYFTPGEVNYYNIECAKGIYDFILQGDLNVTNELRMTSGSDFYLDSNTITTKDFIQTAYTINLQTGALKVTGDFTRTGGTFKASTSVVSLLGNNQTIDADGTSFYKLYKLVNKEDTLTVTAGNTLTIASGGAMRFWGKPEEKTLNIVSSSPGTAYNITNTGDIEAEYTNWTDANFSSAVTASASTSTSNNTNLSVTKEFISTIRATGGDYSLLSSWETAVQTDLTASTTKVFSHDGITGIIADGDTVTGATSGATATAIHATTDQILLESISGTFVSGEQVQVDVSNYVTISDSGFGAISTAECYNDWPSGLADGHISISGWETGANNYIKVYVPENERHSGKVFDGNDYDGFAIVNDTDYYMLGVYEKYTRIEGVIMNQNDKGSGTWHAVEMQSSYSKINSIIVFNSPAAGILMNASSYGDPSYLSNSLFFDNKYGIKAGYVPTLYNVTTVNNTDYGIYKDSSVTAKLNNILAYNNGIKDVYNADGSFNSQSVSTSDDTGDDEGGTGNRINQTFTFTDEDSDDFHLADSDAGAKGYGVDLSADQTFPVIDDIDGKTLPVWDYWDIGADQSAKKIYRSVGPSNTSALAVGTANALNIASQTAIFDSALADNIGVGDAIQYDSDDDGIIDSIAFISERYSSTSYKIQDFEGNTSTQLSTEDNDWSIFRAYTSLFSAEEGDENDGLDDNVEAFEDWSNGKDLTEDDLQWNIACYADAVDTTNMASLGTYGWTTSAQNYLKIYTPYLESEVGESQRHTGTAGTGYHFNPSDNGILNRTEYLTIDGLEISSYVRSYGNTTYRHTNVRNCLFYDVEYATAVDADEGYVENCIIYDFNSSSGGPYVIETDDVIRNCTIYADGGGAYDGQIILRGVEVYNTAIYNTTIGGLDTFRECTGDYNASNDDSAPGSNSLNNLGESDFGFRSLVSGSEDLHLDATSQLIGAGMDFSDYFSIDIDGEDRSNWCIGADEIVATGYKMRGNLKFKGTVKLK